MSEGSLPPFGISRPRSFPGLVKRTLGRLFGGPRRAAERAEPDPALGARAVSALRRHVEEHAAILDRAERLSGKALRLEEAGTPSESAGNRAERAKREVEGGLAALRASFVASEGAEGGEAFDREFGRRYPALGLKMHGLNA